MARPMTANPHRQGPFATITACRPARHHGGCVITVLCPTCGLASEHGLADDEPLLPVNAARTGRCGHEYTLVDTQNLLPRPLPTKATSFDAPIEWSVYLDLRPW
jgi:hypothetical protein